MTGKLVGDTEPRSHGDAENNTCNRVFSVPPWLRVSDEQFSEALRDFPYGSFTPAVLSDASSDGMPFDFTFDIAACCVASSFRN